jgi:hypothetical protein
VTEFREWQTQDELTHPPGEPPPARAIRHGPFLTVGELSGLKDMDPALLARIAPSVTVFFEESGAFEPTHASALAKAAMSADEVSQGSTTDSDSDTFAASAAAEAAAARPDLDIVPEEALIGRTLTVRVTASARTGERLQRAAIIELTGDSHTPYFIRYVE